jgi:hypothetical protein
VQNIISSCKIEAGLFTTSIISWGILGKESDVPEYRDASSPCSVNFGGDDMVRIMKECARVD